jgi:diadenosine tetraphosphatase ApaH/serine/threonine PP2A family protein phosphatase
MLAGLEADVVLVGHTHLPYHRRVGDMHLINVGSAGRPRGGDPRVGYALVELGDDLRATFPRVPYDVEAAARAIEAADLPHEFAAHLRRGGSQLSRTQDET